LKKRLCSYGGGGDGWRHARVASMGLQIVPTFKAARLRSTAAAFLDRLRQGCDLRRARPTRSPTASAGPPIKAMLSPRVSGLRPCSPPESTWSIH
jgi:hypothetical protein